MPVDRDTLKTTIREAVGGDEELALLLEQKLQANDSAATQFLGGFMRNRDYTQKNQSLADERRIMEGQVEQYKGLLESAENEKNQAMKDLAADRISLSEARQRLKNIKTTYALSDDDIPDFQDLLDTKRRGKVVDSSTDLDEKLASFKKEMKDYLAGTLVPELAGLAKLNIVQNDIRNEHHELTGKKLTAKEEDELFNEAERRGKAGRPVSLRTVWEERYEVAELRQKHHDSNREKEFRAKWDAEQQARISADAMAGIRPVGPDQQGLRTGQIFEHKFKVHEDAPAAAAADGKRVTPSASERQSLSGAERAGKRHLERRAAGVPMGAPDERKPGGGKAA